MIPYLTKYSIKPDNTDDWTMLRDFDGGERVVKAQRDRYLPRLTDQSADEYNAYLLRAQFTNFLRQTVNGLRNLVFNRKVEVTLPPSSADLLPELEAFTREGESFDMFSRRVVREVILMGRFGVLIDADSDDGRVYAAGYSTETIIGVNVQHLSGITRPSAILLVEPAETVIDGGESPSVDRYRYRELIQGPFGYEQRVIESDEPPASLVGMASGKVISPSTARGRPLPHIPFTFFGPERLSPIPDPSPVLDLAYEQGHHYRFSADLNWGRHFTALPTPVIIGATTDANQTFSIGPNRAWVLDVDGDAKMLEFEGSGLKYLENAIDKSEQNMIALGARMIGVNTKTGSESPIVAGMRQRNERGLLYSIIDVAEIGLERVLHDWLRFHGRDPVGAKVVLNRDFRDAEMGQRESQMLMRAYLAGIIPRSVLDQALIEGDVLPTNITAQDIAERRGNPNDMVDPAQRLDKV